MPLIYCGWQAVQAWTYLGIIIMVTRLIHQEQQQNQQQFNKMMENFPTQNSTSLYMPANPIQGLFFILSRKKTVKSGSLHISSNIATNPMQHQFHLKTPIFCSFV